MNNTYVLNLSCPDKPGIVHGVSGLLLQHGANIEEAAQYNDPQTGLFFMRVQFACANAVSTEFDAALHALAGAWSMRIDLHETSQRMPTVIMVSQQGHCLNDLLFRWKSGALPLDVRAIISNHRDFYQLAASYNVAFHHFAVTSASKAQVTRRMSAA